MQDFLCEAFSVFKAYAKQLYKLIKFKNRKQRDTSFMLPIPFHMNFNYFIQQFEGTLQGLRQFLISESSLKIMKNAIKALFILKIFKFLS